MEHRFLNKIEYEKSKELWLECFPEDDRSFVDWYYSERSRPEYVLGAFRSGRDIPVSMLHMIPMRMIFGGQERSVCFVAGVCTKPEERGKGLCSRLFETAFAAMRKLGCYATVLQPFDTRFYERFGYKPYIKRIKARLSYNGTNDIVRPTDSHICRFPDPAALKECYEAFMCMYEGYSIRDEAYFNAFIHEYSMPGAYLAFAEEGCCAGYYDETGSRFTATELFFREGFDYTSLFPKNVLSCTFPLPKDIALPQGASGEETEFSMIKTLIHDVYPDTEKCFGFDRY